MAHQLACAISCLHDEKIIHRDLHSSNVLLNQILQGLRETPIPNTPKDYEKLYTDCWKPESYDRPTIHDVVARLEAIISKITKYWTPPINNSSHSSRNNPSLSSHSNPSLSSRNNSSLSSRNNSSLSSRNDSSLLSRNHSSLSSRNHSSLSSRNNSSLSSRKDPSLSSRNDTSLSSRNDTSLSSRNDTSLSSRNDTSLSSRNNSSLSSRNDSSLSSRNDLSQSFKQKGTKSKKDGNHEAWEGLNRLRNAPSKIITANSIDKFNDTSIFFSLFK
ncbi:unnamed protein product [Rhizophagus irregularis]|nr:unnamed protein product [Rhizophagus irregularis]